MTDYTTLTPEQAAKVARAETLKEIMDKCDWLIPSWYLTDVQALPVLFIKNYCKEKLNDTKNDTSKV